MHEDFNTRLWADHGPKFVQAVTALFAEAGRALARLNAIEFDAPWRRDVARNKDQCPTC